MDMSVCLTADINFCVFLPKILISLLPYFSMLLSRNGSFRKYGLNVVLYEFNCCQLLFQVESE